MLKFSSILVLFLLSVAGSEGKMQRKGRGYVEGGEVKPGRHLLSIGLFIMDFITTVKPELTTTSE
jgi:hypothetical protein